MWTEIEGDYKGILMALFFVCFDLPQLSNSEDAQNYYLEPVFNSLF